MLPRQPVTDSAPQRADTKTGWRVTYVGHAAVLIDIASTCVLTDVILRHRVAFLRWTAPLPSAETTRRIDAVLVSHLHRDHCDLPSLRLLGRDRTLLVPDGSVPFFARHGFGNAVPMPPGHVQQVGAVTVTATPAVHDGRRQPLGAAGTAVGFVITAGGRRLYFGGDTDLFAGMAEIAPVDLALVPVAGWGRTLGPGHLDPVRAAEAVRLLHANVAIPIHWGALRPFWHRRPAPSVNDAAARAFAAEVQRRRLPTTVTVLRPGESVSSDSVNEPRARRPDGSYAAAGDTALGE